MHILCLSTEIIIKILHNIDNDVDIKNLLITNKEFYKLYYFLFEIKFIERLKNKELKTLFSEYYEIKEINKKIYPYIKSYMFYNSINPFKNHDYFFICKLYLDELVGCPHLPTYGVIKFYLGPKIRENIFSAKVKYIKEIKKKITNIVIKKNRNYIIMNKKYSLPLSYMRELYTEKNFFMLSNDDNQVVRKNEKFCDKYLFGNQTYQHNNPIKIINQIPKQRSNDWMVILTLDPSYIFPTKEITGEMISFVIKKKYLEELSFNNVYAIYNNEQDPPSDSE